MPSSFASTGTNSEIETLKDVLGNEEVRYVRKGYGLITAALLVCFYFFFFPQLVFSLYIRLPYENKEFMYTFGLIFIHLAVFLVANLGIYLIYHYEMPFFERYKITSEPWPWISDPEGFKEFRNNTIKTVALNQLVMYPLVVIVSGYIGNVNFQVNPDLFPSWKELIPQIVFFMVIEDTCFYWSHRLLHTPMFYSSIHKQHHEYTNTIGIASEYSSPIDFVLTSVLTSALGPLLLKDCHIATLYMWTVLRILETVDGHCGYDFSWSPFRLLPFSGGANYHNFHHSHNVSNYGSFFTYWDTICQTNLHYWRYLSKQEKCN